MIIIPAAGEGRRFGEAGYNGPKHLLPLADKPLIDWVVENVRPLDPNGDVVVATQTLVGKTSGALETLKRAFVGWPPRIDERLVIANCDQLLRLPEDVVHGTWGNGIVFTFKSASSAHSYVTTDRRGRITGIVEKPENPPSDMAVSGVYAFSNTTPIMTAVKDCFSLSAGGEQYFSLALQWMIDQAYSLHAVEAPTAILGTPEDFQRFETALDVLSWDGLAGS